MKSLPLFLDMALSFYNQTNKVMQNEMLLTLNRPVKKKSFYLYSYHFVGTSTTFMYNALTSQLEIYFFTELRKRVTMYLNYEQFEEYCQKSWSDYLNETKYLN